jgi:hypothetical protein
MNAIMRSEQRTVRISRRKEFDLILKPPYLGT